MNQLLDNDQIKTEVIAILSDYGDVVQELKFLEGRKFRFDYAIPDKKLAIELNGGQWSGGRHTRGKGYENDRLKINQAQLRGWTVLEYTYNSVIMQLIPDLKTFFEKSY